MRRFHPLRRPRFFGVELTSALLGILLLVSGGGGQAPGEPLEYFFPEDQRAFDRSIPSPEAFLGYEIGDHHTRHDRIVAYMKELARGSDRAVYREIGRTVGRLPMPVLTVTSPAHHGRVE